MDLIEKIINEICTFSKNDAWNCGRANGLYIDAHILFYIHIGNHKVYRTNDRREAEHIANRALEEERDCLNIRPSIKERRISFHWNEHALQLLSSYDLMKLLLTLRKEKRK